MGYREEIKAANEQGKTLDERWKLRAAVREKYGMGEEKRKRGGVAGTWDRNKQVIKPVAQLAAGAIGGPLAGGIVGGLMGGLDREGKGGIGFDAGEGLKGGLQGAAVGSLGQWGRGAIQGALAKRGMGAAANALPAGAGGPLKPLPGLPSNAADIPGLPAPMRPGMPPAPAAAPLRGRVGKVLDFVKAAPQAVGGALTAGSEMYNAGVNRDISRQTNALNQQQFELERQQYEDERRDKEKRAAIAAQLYSQLMGQMSWGKNPAPQSF